jgi:hypothetical protein
MSGESCEKSHIAFRKSFHLLRGFFFNVFLEERGSFGLIYAWERSNDPTWSGNGTNPTEGESEGARNGMKEKPIQNWNRFDSAQVKKTTEIAGCEGREFKRFAIRPRIWSWLHQNDSDLR